VANRIVRASVEALEDRLAPAQLLLLSSPAEHGLALGHSVAHSAHASRLDSAPSIGTNVEVKTPALLVVLRVDLSLSPPSETALGGSRAGANFGASLLLEPLFTVKAEVTAGSDSSPSDGVSAGVTSGESGGTAGTVAVAISTSQARAQQPTPVSTVPASTPALPVVLAQAGTSQGGNPNAATAVAISAVDNSSGNLIGRAQPAFLLQTNSTGAADASVIQTTLGRPELSGQGPAGGRLPKPDAGFAEGGAGEAERLDEPDAESVPMPQRQDNAEGGVAIPDLALAGASPEAAFAPSFERGDGEEADPLIQAGLFGEGDLPSWLIFAVAVSGLAVAGLAAPQPRRRRGTESLLLADESSIS